MPPCASRAIWGRARAYSGARDGMTCGRFPPYSLTERSPVTPRECRQICCKSVRKRGGKRSSLGSAEIAFADDREMGIPGLQQKSIPARTHAMKSQWNDAAAQELVAAYAAKGVGPDIALRVYPTRLLGRDPLLVLHGGGNTSVKTRASDDLGVEHEVIAVKGAGADMADIEPWGLPAVKLGPLRELRSLDELSDEAMVNVQRLNLLDSSAPNPSVETLLHAFLPHKFLDHTHAAAVLSLVDPPAGEALAREVYDGRMGI